MDFPSKIPDLSVIFVSDFGLSILHHSGMGSYYAKNVKGQTTDLDEGTRYEVIATPLDLAQRFLAEMSNRLVIDSCADRARKHL